MSQGRGFSSHSFFLVLSCAFLGALTQGAPTTYDVLKYGAVGDGRTSDTRAFSAAWNATCNDTGSPTMLIPGGKTFMVGQLQLWGACKSPVQVQVDGNLVRPNEKWVDPGAWLVFIHVDDLTIAGSGQLDGTGQIYWDCKRKSTCHTAPMSLVLMHMKNLAVSGIKFINSPKSNLAVSWVDTVSIHHLTIEAPEDSLNTDGIYVANAANVKIEHNIIGTGDDCISIGNGTVNINVNNITCGPGHGISIGSLGKAKTPDKVEWITITNSHIFKTFSGLRIKTWPGGLGYARNIHYENITIENVYWPILIDQFYCPFQVCPAKPTAVEISDVSYVNVMGTSLSDAGVTLNCTAGVPCRNIFMDTIDIRSSKLDKERKHLATASVCNHVRGTKKGNVVPPIPCLRDI